jgi:hypothetical protein
MILRNKLKKECYRQEEKGLAIALDILKSSVENYDKIPILLQTVM